MSQGITIGPLTIHFYGVIIMLGALLAAWVASREAKRRGISPDFVWDMLPWLLIAGIIGARLWHVLTPPESMVKQGITTWYYFTHPLEAIAVWKGGVGIPGAVAGGVLALWIYVRRNKLSFWQWADIAAPGLALAQAIGRWGNFVNQEVYGQASNLPWAIFIDPAHRLPEFKDVAYYHPLFLYESLWNLLNMAFLLFIGRKYPNWLKKGDIFLVYLIFYPVGRFALEFLRLDVSPVAGLNVNQLLMASIAICAAAALIWKHRPGSTPASQPELETK